MDGQQNTDERIKFVSIEPGWKSYFPFGAWPVVGAGIRNELDSFQVQ